VVGIGLPPDTKPNLFSLSGIEKITESHFIDIRDAELVSSIIKKSSPEIVFHLAAQALVRPSYEDPLSTFSTNVIGTANVLNAIRGIDSVAVVVAVTTDKVYRNLEHLYPYRETDELGGYDPYSASKAASEIIISSYRDSYLRSQGVAVASARAGNVIGGGDWSKDRLIPDAIRAWDSNAELEVRRPDAVRPWQHVLESLNSYLVLAERLYFDRSLSGSYNFGPNPQDAATVRHEIQQVNRIYESGNISWGSGSEGPHEAGLLFLENSLARRALGIEPRWSLLQTIEYTIKWYQKFKSGDNAGVLCGVDIDHFVASQRQLG